MEDEGTRGPVEPSSAEPSPAEEPPIVIAIPAAAAGGSQPLAIFAGIMVLALASFAASAFVLVGVGRVASVEPEATPTAAAVTSAPARTAGAAATAAAGRVRIVSSTARSRPIANGAQHEVTFSWTLEGAREGDPVVLQFYRGTQSLGQQRGALDPQVFNFSTGVLSLTVTMDCSTGGWSAEVLTVRGQPIEGDSDAKAPGTQCPR